MSEEILVNVTPRETRVAVVENGMLQELHIERGWRRGVVGNIYKGRVQRVMPGMQAAFVELGLERAAFLHANDVVRPAPVDAGQTEDAPPQPISTPYRSKIGRSPAYSSIFSASTGMYLATNACSRS